ncbi:MAG TPA: lipid-A-disaccharide synthase [Verrucomicrobiae bacterium]|jgi:lipid-A-disaccharide synthase|nr:lipid-A-disaccharide synthase [Verrucomicrobiae bacterium]
MTFLLSAGEASGDAYGAQLIESLRQFSPNATFFGMGGEKMRTGGCELLIDAKDVAVVGLAEVVTHLPGIYGRFRGLVAETASRKPDAAVLIDFPEFNLRLARKLHALNIPVFYFVSPQIWAWRSGRVKLIQKYVRKMIVIFPFEQEFYREHGVEVSYVGHPLAHDAPPEIARAEFAARYQLDAAKEWIGLLPGSRRKEVRLNLPAMLQAARMLQERDRCFNYQYVLPVASTLDPKWMQDQIASAGAGVPIQLTDNSRATLKHCRAAVVASGTATVEAALAGTPFVVVYRLAALTWLLGRRLVKLDTFAMPNLIAGRKIVRELIQQDFTAENILRELTDIILEGPRRRQMLSDLADVRQRLGDPAGGEPPVARAAREILGSLKTILKPASSGAR